VRNSRARHRRAGHVGGIGHHHGLQLILGHWGEVVLFYTERIEKLQDWTNLGLKKPILEYLRENLSFTGSGDGA